jgi:hypothetical protein
MAEKRGMQAQDVQVCVVLCESMLPLYGPAQDQPFALISSKLPGSPDPLHESFHSLHEPLES